MITLIKLKEYADAKGRDDIYSLNRKFQEGIISESEWTLIENLRAEARLVVNKLASAVFALSIESKLLEHCDSIDTINEIKKIANEDW